MSFISPHPHRRVKLLVVNCVFVALIFHSLLHLHQALVNLHQSWGPESAVENLYQPAVWKPAHSLGGSSSPPPSSSEFPCRRLPGAEDVLVILKTGGTEAHKKLPIHFRTTLLCIPHWRVFSDLEEDIEGYRVHDVLDEIEDGVKKSADEFRLYEKIQQWHARGRIPSAVDEILYKQAWNLDKWKFLPMVKKALQTRPDSKWYFFMEADTSLIWSNLLLYLSRLNPEEPHYIGAQSWIGNTELAYAGSGFIISNKALRMVVEEYTSNVPQYNELTRNEWAGDLVLAKAMKNQGIYPTRSFPILQRETPFTLDYTERHWCFPVVSYHQMTPDWIQAMWNYEQQWLAKEQAKISVPKSLPPEPVRHRHVFAHFVQPAIGFGERMDWHNLSPDQGVEGQTTLETCRSICEAAQSCMQWLWTATGDCKIANVVRLGSRPVAQDDVMKYTSGWMTERVAAFVDKMGQCKMDWILSNADAIW